MGFICSSSGITKMLVVAIVAIIIIGSVIGVYSLLRSPSPSPSPTLSPTPTISTTPTIMPTLPTVIPTPNPNQTSSTPLGTLNPPATNLTQTPTFTPTTVPTPIPTTSPIPTPSPIQSFINVTGHALYELSVTEFVFSDGSKTYNVTMDIATRCVNVKGTLLGGYQFVSQIIMVTSLPITITGTVNGSTIKAETVLIPTDKDKIT